MYKTIKRKPRRSLHAFTLIELLVVLSIIGILSALISINLTSAKYRANYTRILADMDSIADAAKLYKQEMKDWPPDSNRNILPTGLNAYLQSWPKSPCSSIGYDWDNITDESGQYVGISMKYIPQDDREFAPDWPTDVIYYYDISNFSAWPLITEFAAINIATMPEKRINCPSNYNFNSL